MRPPHDTVPGLASDGWPDSEHDQRHDPTAQVNRTSGRKVADVFVVLDDCVDLQIELGLWVPHKEPRP